MQTKVAIDKTLQLQRDISLEWLWEMHISASHQATHQRRVSIKRLKAYLHFHQFISDNTDTRSLSTSLRKLYKIAGEYRKRQLIPDMIKLHKDALHAHSKELKKRLQNKQKDAAHNLEKFPHHQDAENENIRLLYQSIRTTIRQTAKHELELHRKSYLHRSCIAIHALNAHPNISNESLHEVRKVIKELMYLHKLYSDDIPTFKQLKHWAKYLGTRNDLVDFISVLQEFSNHAPKKKQLHKLIEKLQKQANQEKELLKALVCESLILH